MVFSAWLIWFIIAVICTVAEVFTGGFFIIWFGIGAIVAGIVALLGLVTVWQWSIFLLVSLILLLSSKRFAKNVTKEQPLGVGANRVIGKAAVVTKEIDMEERIGEVSIEGELWRAKSENDERIQKDIRVKVIRIEGTLVIVSTQLEEVTQDA